MTSFRSVLELALAGAVLGGCAKKEHEAAEGATPASAAVTPGAQSYALVAPDSLRPLARIALDSAVKVVLARVPNGAIEKVELEREGGAVIWSFDVKVPGQAGTTEVNVNAATGAVAPTERENAAAEAREAREDSAAARTRAQPATKRP